MRKSVLRVAPLVLAAVFMGCVGEPDVDPNVTEDVTADGTRILRSESGFLTTPSTEEPSAIAVDFLLARGAVVGAAELDLQSMSVSKRGVTHVRLEERVEGLRVHGAYARVALSEEGEIIQVIHRLARADEALEPVAVDARTALEAVLRELGYLEVPGRADVTGNLTTFEATPELFRAPTVEHVAYLGEDGAARAGFLVETWSNEGNRLHHTVVDGHGAIVSVELRTANDTYNVFVEDPLKGSQTLVAGPGAGNAQSPAGWLGAGAQTTVNISGNNTKTYWRGR